MSIVRVIDWPEALRVKSYVCTDKIYPSDKRLNPDEAEKCIEHLRTLGFPLPTRVNLVNATTDSIYGEETDGMCFYIFAFSEAPSFLHRIFFHEYGHTVDKNCMVSPYHERYWALRGEPSENGLIQSGGKGEIFAEDFRMLFGTDLARSEEHTKRIFVGDLGFSLAPVVQQNVIAKDGMTYAQWQEALRQVVRGAVAAWKGAKSMTQPTEKPMFSDITGHWAESVIIEIAQDGLMQGYPDGTFGPDKGITRAEMAVILKRLKERSKQDG